MQKGGRTWWRRRSLLSCLKVKLRRTRKPPLNLPRPFFLGRDDKYPSHLMTVAHILCDEMLLSNGKQHLWEVSHVLRLSRMLVTVPGTGSSVSELSTFPSMCCKALPALLPQQSQSWELEGTVAGLKPVASASREKGAVCLVSLSLLYKHSLKSADLLTSTNFSLLLPVLRMLFEQTPGYQVARGLKQ